ncbi:hypothetical protein Syun_001764 [Stephania yunnanensis]|uniref:Uncharacterized protein n=1 Tax=Stephania yunnanensis TaxID=152371 RepID=A0AAP0LK63_9MAGN
MNVPAIHGGLLKPDVVEGTDDERVWRLPCWELTETSKRDDGIDLLKDNQALQHLTGTDDNAKMDLSSLTQTNISFNQNLMAEEDRVPQLPLPLTKRSVESGKEAVPTNSSKYHSSITAVPTVTPQSHNNNKTSFLSQFCLLLKWLDERKPQTTSYQKEKQKATEKKVALACFRRGDGVQDDTSYIHEQDLHIGRDESKGGGVI